MGQRRAVSKASQQLEEVSGHDAPLVTHERPLEVRTVFTCAIDEIAMASLREQQAEDVFCDVCEQLIDGEVRTTGLMMWTRGDDVRYDEPPLCEVCASGIAVSAWTRWSHFTEE